MFDEITATGLDIAGKLPNLIKSGMDHKSLVEYTKAARVEPVVLVDQKAVYVEFMHDLMQSLNSIFSGYYLQAMALSVDVGNVETAKKLDKFNPNRNLALNLESAMLDASAYQYQLPRVGVESGLDRYAGYDLQPSLESSAPDKKKQIEELANLSVGKIHEVDIQSQGQKVTLPISVRLIANSINPETLVHILESGGQDMSIKERWHQWKAGQIRFVKDLILAEDLIRDHRRALMKDKDNHYQRIMSRKNQNRISTLLSGELSVGTASNIAIMTESTKDQLEREMSGRLSNFKMRQRIFEQTYLMILAVVDPEWDQVTLYHSSIEEPTELHAKDLKRASDSRGGPDVSEILKAYQVGNSPTL